MITIDDFKPLTGKLVTISTQDTRNPEKTFFYYGYLEKVGLESVKLRFSRKEGFILIPIERIQSIKVREEYFDY